MRAFKLCVLPKYTSLCFHSCWPFVGLHCQAWKCLAVLFFFLFFYLAHSWRLLPPSLKHFCVFEAGEHPHTHTTTDPCSWLVLNPWQGALSLNIKDPHLRACRQDSPVCLTPSRLRERPTRWMWQGPLEDTVMSVVWAELRCIVTELSEHLKLPAVCWDF